jgi:biotin-(acetyl-CoA carboxylase) ligase
LADLVVNAPAPEELAVAVLAELRRVLEEMDRGGFAALLPRVNQLWGHARRVELDLDGTRCEGMFQGVDAKGRLILSNEAAGRAVYEPWEVRHLTEKE